MYTEEELLPLSALQHLLFCERQCALIHIEGLWAENRLTVEGRQLHERADVRSGETRGTIRIARGLALRSLELGLVGRADVVEFHVEAGGAHPRRVVPIEYKRGRPKTHDADRVQLCAQAMCLEEMLQVDVADGALFYGRTRRRLTVAFDSELRERTRRTAEHLHLLIDSGATPRAVREKKCDQCSLLDLCLPDALHAQGAASAFVEQSLKEAARLHLNQ